MACEASLRRLLAEAVAESTREPRRAWRALAVGVASAQAELERNDGREAPVVFVREAERCAPTECGSADAARRHEPADDAWLISSATP